MMPSSWSTMRKQPSLQDDLLSLAQEGERKIASGEVSPEQLKNVTNLSNQINQSTKTTTQKLMPVMMSDDEFNSQVSSMENTPLFQKRLQDVNSLGEMINKRQASQNTGFDISPLLGYVDSKYGTQFTKTYNKPKTEQEVQDEGIKAAQMLMGERNNVYKDILDSLGARKLGTTQTSTVVEDLNNTQKSKDETNTRIKFTKDFDAYTKKQRDALDASASARAAIQSGTPVGDNAVVNFMARASSEVGPLTASDRSMFTGSSALVDKAVRLHDKLLEGRSLTEQDRDGLNILLNAYEKINNKKIDDSAKFFIDQRGPSAYKIDPFTAREILQPKTKNQPTTQGGVQLKGSLEEVLKRRGL